MISIFIKIAVIATVVAVATTGIIVGVIVGVVPTITTNEDACATLRAPTDLRIAPVENFLSITWANSTDDCADHYEILVEMNGAVINDTTEIPFYFFEHTAYCTELNISVTRIAEDGRRSAPVSQSYIRDVPEDTEIVTRIDFAVVNEIVRASWEPLDTFQHCTVEYILKIDDNEAFTPPNNNYYIFQDGDLEYCREILLTLTPIIGGVSHTVATTRHTPEVPVPSEVVNAITIRVDDDEGLIAEWSPLGAFSQCAVSYQLQIDENPAFPIPNNNYYIFQDGDLEFCREIELTLTPIIDGISHTVETKKHIPVIPDDFGTKFNPHTFELVDNQLQMDWVLEDKGACDVTYTGYCVLVESGDVGDPIEIVSRHTFTTCDVIDDSPHTLTVSIRPLLNLPADVPVGTEPSRPETVCTVLIDQEIVVGEPVCEAQYPPSVKFNDKNT